MKIESEAFGNGMRQSLFLEIGQHHSFTNFVTEPLEGVEDMYYGSFPLSCIRCGLLDEFQVTEAMGLQQTTCAAVTPRCIGLDNRLGWMCVAKQSTILCSWIPNDTPLQVICACNAVGGNQEANFSAGTLSRQEVEGFVFSSQSKNNPILYFVH